MTDEKKTVRDIIKRQREKESFTQILEISQIRTMNDFFLVASFPLSAEVVKRSNVYATECC